MEDPESKAQSVWILDPWVQLLLEGGSHGPL